MSILVIGKMLRLSTFVMGVPFVREIWLSAASI